MKLSIVVSLKVLEETQVAKRKPTSSVTSIAESNTFRLVNDKAKGIQFNTLTALCRELDCQPSDIFEYVNEENG